MKDMKILSKCYACCNRIISKYITNKKCDVDARGITWMCEAVEWIVFQDPIEFSEQLLWKCMHFQSKDFVQLYNLVRITVTEMWLRVLSLNGQFVTNCFFLYWAIIYIYMKVKFNNFLNRKFGYIRCIYYVDCVSYIKKRVAHESL